MLGTVRETENPSAFNPGKAPLILDRETSQVRHQFAALV